MTVEITHKTLVDLAAHWLERRCGVVLTEYSCQNSGEIADALGLRPWPRGSILIECKVSRRDFLADQQKAHRGAPYHLGNYRYYLTTRNLVHLREVPEDWGLLYVMRGEKLRVKVMKEAPLQASNDVTAADSQVLYSLARRAVLRGLIPQLREDFNPRK